MRILKERSTPSEIVAAMALLSGAVALLSLLSGFFPFLTPFLMLVVPLASSLIALTCPLKWLWVFVLTAFLTSLGVAFFDFQTLLFYLLPSLLTGACFGAFWKKRLPALWNLFLNGVASTLMLLATLSLSKALYGVSFYDLLRALLPFGDPKYLSDVFLLFCFAYGLGQTAIVYVFLRMALEKLRIEENDSFRPKWGIYLCAGLSFAIGLGCAFFFVPGSYLCLGFLLFWTVASSVEEMPYRHMAFYLLDALGIFLSILLFALLYSRLPADTGLLLTAFPALFLLLVNGLNASLPPSRTKHKIEQP